MSAHPPDDQLRALLDGSLAAPDRAAVTTHLEGCDACAARVTRLTASSSDDRTGDIGQPAPISQTTLLVSGQRVGHFVIESRLGEGGMGVVYAAHDPKLDRRVAVKVLRSEPGDGSQGSASAGATRLMREAQAMARLSHPNVVTIYEVGDDAGTIFIAMELVEGTTLNVWLRETRRTQAQLLKVFSGAAAGLGAAHRAGMVHRDFKPDNVLIGDDGRVLVSDFGLARAANTEASPSTAGLASPVHLLDTSVTQGGVVPGTLSYMAPEQIRGQPLDPRADQFAFCVVLYEALYGERPFSRSSLEGVVRAAPAGATVPTWLRQVLLRGLANEPSTRFPTMDALVKALSSDPTTPAPLPAKSTRPWLLAAAAGLAVVTLVAVLVPRGAKGPCDAKEHRLDGIWDSASKQQMQKAFLASGSPTADKSWQYVERELDAYGTRWNDAYQDACDATLVRHDQSETGLRLRLDCLEVARDRLKVITEYLAQGHQSFIKAAPGIVAITRPVEGCDDATALAVVAPPLPGMRQKVQDLRRRQVLAKAEAVVDPNASIAPIRALLAEAEDTRFLPLKAELLADLGHAYSQRGAHAEAIPVRLEALKVADQAHDSESAAIEACNVAIALELAGKPRAEADVALADARARVERSNKSVRTQEIFEHTLTVIYSLRGDHAQSAAHARATLELSKRLHLAPKTIAQSYNNLSASLEAIGQYDEALAAVQAGLAEIADLPGLDDDGTAQTMYCNVVWLACGNGECSKARDTAQRVIASADQRGESRYSVIIRAFMVNVMLDDADRAGALAMATRATDQLAALKLETTYDAIEVRRQLAIGYLRLGQPVEARLQLDQLFAVSNVRISPTSSELVPYLMVSGQAWLEQGQPAKARAELERALRLGEGHTYYPGWGGRMRFDLARALVALKVDRPRTVALASQAARELEALPRHRAWYDELTAWAAAQKVALGD
jgi:serine/threonine protein kinase/tetratricopeptide (TPR) repeat protein